MLEYVVVRRKGVFILPKNINSDTSMMAFLFVFTINPRMVIVVMIISLINIALMTVATESFSSPAINKISDNRNYKQKKSLGEKKKKIVSLQNPHEDVDPAVYFQTLSKSCKTLGITKWDLYGDFHVSDTKESFLRQFETELAQDFGKEDAVFMPSGVMAQSIALLIHSKKGEKKKFLCHHSSHLLLHEKDAYRELLNLEPIIISTDHDYNNNENDNNGVESVTPFQRTEPLLFRDVELAIFPPPLTEEAEKEESQDNDDNDRTIIDDTISTLILELPHRELGGKCTPFEDIQQMSNLCKKHSIKFHCDGARIFETITAGYGFSTPQEIARPFDSIYISFYKGLEGLSGAMLLGSSEFCDEARVWLRRFGGNLYTLLPYAATGWAGYKKHWLLQEDGDDDNKKHDNHHKNEENNNIDDNKKSTAANDAMSFEDKKRKLVALVQNLSEEESITKKVVCFDPEVPQVNMVHGYLRATVEDCIRAMDHVEQERCNNNININNGIDGDDPSDNNHHHDRNIRVLHRLKEVSLKTDPGAYKAGYRSKFEWIMGEANSRIDNQVFITEWNHFARSLLSQENTLIHKSNQTK